MYLEIIFRDVMKKERKIQKVKQIFSLSLTQPYRSQYGSVNPTAIVGPGIVATAVSTVAAVVYCKVMEVKQRT